MKLLNRMIGKDTLEIVPGETFAAKIIFECNRVPDNRARVEAAVTEFMEKYIHRLAEAPKVTQATDGNVIELTLICDDREELLQYNRDIEIIAYRYGLRD